MDSVKNIQEKFTSAHTGGQIQGVIYQRKRDSDNNMLDLSLDICSDIGQMIKLANIRQIY